MIKTNKPNLDVNLIESLPFGDISSFYQPARWFADWSRYKTIKQRCIALDKLERLGDIIRIVFNNDDHENERASFVRLVSIFQSRSGKTVRFNFCRPHLAELELIGRNYRKRAKLAV